MLVLSFLLAAAPAPFQELEILDQNIRSYADAEPIDKRLKLAQCPDDPIIAPAVGGVVVVRCPALGWRIRVPVRTESGTDKSAHIVIRKGDMIECVTDGPGFAVSAQMIALDDASIGQSLRVKSLTSPIPMSAVAKERGLAAF
jgi:flagella basal body P-ring formation protein FlgA